MNEQAKAHQIKVSTRAYAKARRARNRLSDMDVRTDKQRERAEELTVTMMLLEQHIRALDPTWKR